MAMRSIAQLSRVVVHSARSNSLVHQLPRTNYNMVSVMFRDHGLDRVLPISCTCFNRSVHTIKDNKEKTIEEMVTERIEDVKSGKFERMKHPEKVKHFRTPPALDAAHSMDPIMVPKDGATTGGSYTMPHPIWSEGEVQSVRVTHKTPKGLADWLAYLSVKSLRSSFDWITGFNRRTRDEELWINRIIFMETISGVPGIVAAVIRHLHSIRKMRRDHGWIQTLLEESENERMHLVTALQLKHPSLLFKATVVTTQGVFVALFALAYLVAPRYCHRFVGYMEEQAVQAYTKCLKDIDEGPLGLWKTKPAPCVAIDYWNLAPTATMKDVILAIRADEAHHRVVNHTLASMKKEVFNPYQSQ